MDAIGLAFRSIVALNAASTALLRWAQWAVGGTMAFLLAHTTSAGELALDAWVRALSLVVTLFAAVEAAAAVTASLWLVRAVACEVAVCTATVRCQPGLMSGREGIKVLHAAAIIAGTTLKVAVGMH